MVRQNRLWTNDMKEAISQALHNKVTESLGAGKLISSRMPMQDYSWFRVFDAKRLGQNFASRHHCQRGPEVQCGVQRLWKLGLRAPSEPTYSMITVVLLMMELMRLSDGIQLRSAKNCLKAKTDENNGAEFCKPLPPMPTSLAEERYKRVFPQ